MNIKRIAVLASGAGSNLESILDYFASLGSDAPGQIVLVASDRAQAGALQKARDRQIDTVILRESTDLESHELLDLLTEHHIDLVVLAGYLRLISPAVVDAFAGRMVNIHPALLPKHGGPGMYGLRVHQAVINHHEPISGATVHVVTHEYDSGPILAQWPVPVLLTDDAPTLAKRVLQVEHALYPRIVAAMAGGRLNGTPIKPAPEYFADPPVSPDGVAAQIDALIAPT